MDNLNDDSENNAKVSDSAYSNSCSNSQSRRSNSSKSTHSGSNSSGSSGYGGLPSSASGSNATRVKEKETKKKKLNPGEILVLEQSAAPTDSSLVTVCVIEETHNDGTAKTPKVSDEYVALPSLVGTELQKPENMEIAIPDSIISEDEANLGTISLISNQNNNVITRPCPANVVDGFSCVISMHDGVVMYATSSITSTLGFPKEMWIGRSFIDFIHPKDRSTFSSQITSGLVLPKKFNVCYNNNAVSTLFCRLRKYRGLSTAGFGVKDQMVTFMPFLLKLSFKNIIIDEGKETYLVIQASPCFSAFKYPNEIMTNGIFVIRHITNGNFEYLDPESVPYLGYLPQDVTDRSVLQLYHPEDLNYLNGVYEIIVKEGEAPRSKSFRIMAQNGDYVRIETEWSSFINPWTRKLEFVIGKHHVVEGPTNPDVFQIQESNNKAVVLSEEEKSKAQALRLNIVRTMNEVLTKPAEVAKQQMTKRCQDLASFMETLMEEQPKDESIRNLLDQDNSYYEHDSVMLGGISPHHENNDSKSSTETQLSYNQMNYNENLQRYFDSHHPFCQEEYEMGASDKISEDYDGVSSTRKCISPRGGSETAASSGESNTPMALDSSSGTSFDDSIGFHLTETLLEKHNIEMEKDFIKKHREHNKSNSRGERDRFYETRKKKKKETMTRSNVILQSSEQPHGVKRGSTHLELDIVNNKHHKPLSRQIRRRVNNPNNMEIPNPATISSSIGWSGGPVNGVALMGPGMPTNMPSNMGVHQQVPIMGPVVTGVMPMYYVTSPITTNADSSQCETPSNNFQPSSKYDPANSMYLLNFFEMESSS